MLPKINTALMFNDMQTKDNISATQHMLQYNSGVTIQDNAVH